MRNSGEEVGQIDSFEANLFKRLNEFQRKYNRYIETSAGNTFLMKYNENSSKLLKLLSPPPNHKESNLLDVDTVLRLYTQTVLDLTYFEENKLVDDDFCSSNADETVIEIINELLQVETLHNESSERSLVAVLGVELVETLHWRKGALMYMYCFTMYNDKKRYSQSAKLILQYCQEGVMYLQKMLSVRNKEETSVTLKDNDTLSLLKNGLYSDIHMLAAMYAGEMCYWFCKHEHSTRFIKSNETLEHFNKEVKTIAKTVLTVYVEAVDGPLKAMGWSSDKAKQILKELS